MRRHHRRHRSNQDGIRRYDSRLLMFDAAWIALVALILVADWLLGVISDELWQAWRHRH